MAIKLGGGASSFAPDTSVSTHGISTSTSGSTTTAYTSYTGTFYYMGCTAYTGDADGGGTTTVYIGDYPSGAYFTLDSVSSSNRWQTYSSQLVGTSLLFSDTTITVHSSSSSTRANNASVFMVRGVA